MPFIWAKGCLLCVGSHINEIAKKQIASYDDSIFQNSLKNRIERDGENFHVTIITPDEVSNTHSSYSALHHVKDEITKDITKENINLTDEVYDFGIGKVERDGNATFYVYCYVLNGNKIREQFDLPPKDYHITLGFTGKDIHDKPKSLNTLIKYDRQHIEKHVSKFYGHNRIINELVTGNFIRSEKLLLNIIKDNQNDLILMDMIGNSLSVDNNI